MAKHLILERARGRGGQRPGPGAVGHQLAAAAHAVRAVGEAVLREQDVVAAPAGGPESGIGNCGLGIIAVAPGHRLPLAGGGRPALILNSREF